MSNKTIDPVYRKAGLLEIITGDKELAESYLQSHLADRQLNQQLNQGIPQ